jgi:tetratricopeptide (TPR) repeat protein
MTWIAQIIFASSLTIAQANAQQLNDNAKAFLAAGDTSRAVVALEQALASAEAGFGADHPATAMIVRNLALAYANAGQLPRAEKLAIRAITVLEARFGRDDVSIVPALNVLGETLIYEGRLREALPVLERAVAFGPGAGAHYTTALQNLGAALELQGDGGSAQRYYTLAAAERGRLLGSDRSFARLAGRTEVTH